MTMDGREPAAVPALLQPLVDFLELDERPTAIFQRLSGDAESKFTVREIYRNASFANLRLNEVFVTRIVERLQASAGADPNAAQRSLEQWKLQTLQGDFDVLLSVSADNITREPGEQSDGLVMSAGNDALRKSRIQTSTTSLTDWTQYEVPGLSPWIEWVRSRDWSQTELGDISTWDGPLRGHMLNLMSNPNPRLMIWGPKMTFVYNEACIPHWGEKHPHCFAKPIQEPWAEAWEMIEPIIRAVYRGEVMQQHNLPVPIFRNGFVEETYFDYTMLPIYGEDGRVEGVIDEIYETTSAVRSERRRTFIIDFNKHLSGAPDLPSLWSRSLEGLAKAPDEVAHAILYAVIDAPTNSMLPNWNCSGEELKLEQACVLQGSIGFETSSAIPESFILSASTSTTSGIAKACVEACKNRVPVVLNSKDGTLPTSLNVAVPGRAFSEAVQRAVVTPIFSISGNVVLAILISGLNPRAPLDQEYSLCFDYLGDVLTKAASSIALPEEPNRTQQSVNDVNTALSAKLRMVTLQAERSEAKYARMAASAPTGMFVFGRDGLPLYANDEFLQIMGRTRDEHFRMSKTLETPSDNIHDDDIERYTAAYKQLTEQKVPVTVDYRLKEPWKSVDKATGQEMVGERWLLANAFPDLDYDGEIQSVQGWITDISYRRFTEKLISTKLEEALESKRLTENFIDMTSHEMRNPLSAMLQSADSIVTLINAANAQPRKENHCRLAPACTLDNEAAADILDAAQTIVLCAQHQKRIVDDILTLSKLDASLVTLCPEKVRLPSLLDQALRMFEAEIARVDTLTRVVIEPSWRDLNVDWVVLDASRLLQIIINLVTNSIKFIQGRQRREITIALGASYQKPTGTHHGVAFVPRTREDNVQTAAGGWGEGEDIYVQIAVTDTGRGLSEEELKLLFHRFSQGSPKTYKQYGGSGLGLYISLQLCELQGGQIGASSGDGKTTFTFFVRAKRWQQGNDEQLQGHANILDDSVAVPPPKKLSSKTTNLPERLLNRTNTSPARVEHEQDEERRRPSFQQRDSKYDPPPGIDIQTPLHVLLVEDNKINQRITAQQLRKAGGFTVHVADHGGECLDFLAQTTFCGSHEQPTDLDIILLDLEMPIMDGWACAREIRQRQREGHIAGHVPVIAVTANARPEQITSALEAGADAVVTKPFRIPDLIPRMRQLVDKVARQETG